MVTESDEVCLAFAFNLQNHSVWLIKCMCTISARKGNIPVDEQQAGLGCLASEANLQKSLSGRVSWGAFIAILSPVLKKMDLY
jgi:hypothetical protein